MLTAFSQHGRRLARDDEFRTTDREACRGVCADRADRRLARGAGPLCHGVGLGRDPGLQLVVSVLGAVALAGQPARAGGAGLRAGGHGHRAGPVRLRRRQLLGPPRRTHGPGQPLRRTRLPATARMAQQPALRGPAAAIELRPGHPRRFRNGGQPAQADCAGGACAAGCGAVDWWRPGATGPVDHPGVLLLYRRRAGRGMAARRHAPCGR